MKAYKFLLTALFIEGLFAFVWLFSERSMERNAFLFGYSTARIALGALIIIALALLGWWMVIAFTNRPTLRRIDQRVDYFAQHPGRLMAVFTFLGLAFLFILFLLLLIPKAGLLSSSFLSSSFDDLISTLIAIINRTKPLLVWILLIILQTAAFLFARVSSQ